jgi:predicted outer membrane repeat protein
VGLWAAAGGGLYRSFPQHSAIVRNCRFIKNKAGQYGGAIYEQNVADGLVQVRFAATVHQSPLVTAHCLLFAGAGLALRRDDAVRWRMVVHVAGLQVQQQPGAGGGRHLFTHVVHHLWQQHQPRLG